MSAKGGFVDVGCIFLWCLCMCVYVHVCACVCTCLCMYVMVGMCKLCVCVCCVGVMWVYECCVGLQILLVYVKSFFVLNTIQ